VSSPKQTLGSIAAAAHALETELERFQQASDTAVRLPLTSRRNLDKAANAINEAADSQKRIGEHIHTLMVALNTARDQNQRTADTLAPRGAEIQARLDEHGQLWQRLQDLGQVAKEITAQVRGGAGSDPKETVNLLQSIEQRMGQVVIDAQHLTKAAREANLGELVQDAEGLTKQVQSARNKLGLALAKLAK
jgi:hypothetical protein